MYKNPSYQEFKQMMDQVGREIVRDNKDKQITLAFSGDLDLVAVLMSLLHTEKQITLVHMNHLKLQSYGVPHKELAKYISEILNLPFINIPCSVYGGGLDAFSNLKILKVVC